MVSLILSCDHHDVQVNVKWTQLQIMLQIARLSTHHEYSLSCVKPHIEVESV